MTSQGLTFFVNGDEYAVEIDRVREVLSLSALTRIPTTPPWMRGVMNLRGTVVPVIDLAQRFGASACAFSRWTCVIVLDVPHEGRPTSIGLLADMMNDILELDGQVLAPPPAFGTVVRPDFIKGMAPVGERFAMLLDVDRLLSLEELTAAVRAAQDPGAIQEGKAS